MPKFIVLSGTHSRSEDGKRVTYKKGDTIDATEEELKGFLDKFRRVGPPDKPDKPKEEVKKLQIEHRGGGRYNVVNAESGKPINSELLSRDEAQEIVDSDSEPPSEEEAPESTESE